MNTTNINTTTPTKGYGNRNINEVLQWHAQSKRFIGGICKLERDGTLTKINGQVFAVKTTKSGLAIALIDNLLRPNRKGTKKRWQAVLVKNIKVLNESHWHHEKLND